jgi:phenylalanyl-tRNA synthetase beta chain
VDAAPVAGAFPCPVDIRIEDAEGCPAFYGRVIRGVKNGPSPQWLQDRLKSAGQRPISALVDVTNYVMLAYGRPAHAYDLAKLNGAVVARRAAMAKGRRAQRQGIHARSTMTVIADAAGVHDVAGIMGGEHSGCRRPPMSCSKSPISIRRIARTGQALALTSDARGRFERGVDPAFLDAGIELLTRLILDICGGEASDVLRVGAPPLARKTVAYDPALAGRLGGVAVPEDEQRRILAALGFEAAAEDWTVTVPTGARTWMARPTSWRK